MTVNGIQKSALLLMSIGSDQASEILKYLTPFEIQELAISMINIHEFSNSQLHKVLSECYDIFVKNNNFISNNNKDYVSDMLIKALGEKKGHNFLHKALEIQKTKICISILNAMSSNKVASLLNKEHPQIITAILVNLNRNHVARIISFFNNEKRAEIILRIIEFNGIKEENLSELNNVVNNLLKVKNNLFLEKGGIKVAANILNSMKIEYEKDILKKISNSNKNISRKIIKEIFLFENVVNISDKFIECLLNNLDHEKLYVALQGANDDIRKKFFVNMDKKLAQKLSKNLEKKSYFSKTAIKNEQKLILMILKNILENGVFIPKTLGKYYV